MTCGFQGMVRTKEGGKEKVKRISKGSKSAVDHHEEHMALYNCPNLGLYNTKNDT